MQAQWTKEKTKWMLSHSEGFYAHSNISKEFLVQISVTSWQAMYNYSPKFKLERNMNKHKGRQKTKEMATDYVYIA
jgi:Zn/Cd-binding protein ZinT